MKLLTFAHRPEAQTFIASLNAKRLNQEFLSVFVCEKNEYLILITGEGIQSTTQAVCTALSLFQEITEIINFGVSGAADNKLQQFEIHSIRTTYAYFEDMEFKSFTSADNLAKTDCLTSNHRVLEEIEKKKLSAFANIIDRELWAIGSVAAKFKKPWRSFKIIADLADEQVRCQEVKDLAISYSEKLFKNFTLLENIDTSKIAPIYDLSELHFTQSSKIIFQKIFDAYLKFFNISSDQFFKSQEFLSIKNSEKSKKIKATELISFMQNALDPISFKTLENLKDFFRKFESITFDHSLEKSEIIIHRKINSQASLKKIKKELDTLDYSAFLQIFNGEK